MGGDPPAQAAAARRPPAAAQRPLVTATAALAGGAAAGALWPALGAWAWAAVAAALGFVAGARSAGVRAPWAWLALACALQVARASHRFAPRDAPPASVLAAQPGAQHRASAAQEGVWREQRVDAEHALGALEGQRARFEIERGSARDGERVRLWTDADLSVEAPVLAGRAGRSGLGAIANVAPDALQRLVPRRAALGLDAWSERLEGLRARLDARAERFGTAPAAQRTASLARALVLGRGEALDPGLADLFARTGLRHLLAVSGMHVGLYALTMAWPLAALGALALAWLVPPAGARRRVLTRLLAVALLCAYAPLVGAQVPVRRATLAAVLVALGPLLRGPAHPLGRGSDAWSLWCAALALECAVDPAAIGAVGVQLSYAATLGLIAAGGPLARAALAWQRDPLDGLRDGAPAPLAWWRAIRRKVASLALAALAASACASLATLPIVWAHFGECGLIGVLATPPAMLLVAWLLPSGWLALAWPTPLSRALFALPCRALVDVAQFADALPGSPWTLPQRPWWALVAVVALAVLCLRGVLRGRVRWLVRAGAALGGAALLAPWCAAPRGVELHAFDVGHGSALALRGPSGECVLFDAGSRDVPRVGPDVLGPALARWDAARPALVLSHDQRDHASGLAWLIERYPPRWFAGALPARLAERLPHTVPVFDGGPGWIRLPTSPLAATFGAASSSAVAAGFLVDASPGVDAGPGAPRGLELILLRGAEGGGNEGSRSLWVRWEGFSALLSGDAEGPGLPVIAALAAERGPLGVLVLPHHGSHCDRLGALLEALRPRRVWVSCAGSPALAAELERRGLDWRATGLEGDLQACSGERGLNGPTADSTAAPLARNSLLSGDGSSVDARNASWD